VLSKDIGMGLGVNYITVFCEKTHWLSAFAGSIVSPRGTPP